MAMRGYPEVPIPTRLDDIGVGLAVSLGLHCVGLLPPMLALMLMSTPIHWCRCRRLRCRCLNRCHCLVTLVWHLQFAGRSISACYNVSYVTQKTIQEQ
jgi:hypothetical protein